MISLLLIDVIVQAIKQEGVSKLRDIHPCHRAVCCRRLSVKSSMSYGLDIGPWVRPDPFRSYKTGQHAVFYAP